MAENKARHAFGSSENLQNALNSGAIDAYDILFLDGDTKPKVGWVDKNGDVKIVSNETDLSGIEAEVATKANAKEVNAKIDEIETALDDVANASYTHEKIKYEIADVPVGTLTNYRDGEIRICCPNDAEYHLQSVGSGGDAHTYYVTFKTYVYDDNIVGYKEHLNDKADAEILTDLKTDKYGRRFQPTWLGIAKYDESTNTWTYDGANSTTDKMIGWDYQIDWFDANGVMVASDCVRINLSNEECHSSIKPYYGVSETEEVDTKIDEAVESANAYTDAQIKAKMAEIEEASSYTIVEF